MNVLTTTGPTASHSLEPPAGPPGASLFPAATASWVDRRLLAAGYLAGGAAVAGAALLRQTGAPAWKTMWAEDGKIFYSQALSLPFFRTLVTPHAGYVQLFPRLVAGLASLFQPGSASLVMALAGAASLGALSCLVFHMARGVVASPVLRTVLAASIVLLPVANEELLDNAVNVPWWLFFACFWALLWRPPSRAGKVGVALLCALAAASEPLTALLLPVVVFRWFVLRRPGDQAAGAGLVAGLVYQGAATLAGGSGGGALATFAPGRYGAVAQAFGLRVGLELVGGVKATNWLAGHERGLATALGFVLVCLLVVAAVACRSRRAVVLTCVAVLGAAACFVLAAWVRGVAPILAADKVQTGGRYQAVPLLLLVSAIVVIADSWAAGGGQHHPFAQSHSHPFLRRVRSGRGFAFWARFRRLQRRQARPEPGLTPRRALAGGEVVASGQHPYLRRREITAAAICLVLLAPTWAADFRDTNPRSHGPSWPAGIAQAARRCAGAGAGTVVVHIDPQGWKATLPCRALVLTRS